MNSALPVKKQIIGLIGWTILVFVAAATGAAASIAAGEFYNSLALPKWAPPASVFGPVWTALYALMAIAAWLVWRKGPTLLLRPALSLFIVQLILNALWSWLFFKWKMGAWAFVDIIVLWFLISTTVIFFWRIQRLAGVLLLPYLAWVSFAALLNFVIWQNNLQILG